MTVALRQRHVLVVGIDGVRADTLRTAHTPAIDALASRGFFATVRVDERNPTVSGPVWATVATGTYRDKHGVHGNDLRGHRLEAYPDFLARLRAAHPWAATFAAAAWGPLVTPAAGGPVFTGDVYRPGLPEDAEEGSLEVIAAMDEAVTARAARELLRCDPAAVFGYLVLADMAGHREGVGAAYRAAIEACDEQLAVMLAAIEARPGRADEEWTVIVVTDHGHLDAGHHGGDSAAERTAWIAAAGPGIDASSGVGVDHADVLPQVMRIFDVAVEPAWGIEGVPFGQRAAARQAPADAAP